MEGKSSEKGVKFDQEAMKSVEEEDGDLSNRRNLDWALHLDEIDDEFETIKHCRKKPGVAIAMQVIFHFHVAVYAKINGMTSTQ